MTSKDISTKPTVTIYTDGACSGNPGPGGWGVLLQFENSTKELFGFELETTNNRMELTAAIKGLCALKKPCKVELHTDSKYVQQGITEWIHKWLRNNWHRSENELVKNADLWQTLYSKSREHDVTWHWVKGHGTSVGNQIADSLAVQGRDIAKSEAKMGSKCHS